MPAWRMVDPAALEAAILNVALNARDAMPEGGTLTIRTSKADITQAPRTEDDLPIGQYAMLAIQDTGTGMPPDVVQRVFEPFFTTKTGGTGSGLGLSMVYGFAKQSGGVVTIASEVGRGTTVIIYLPLTKNKPIGRGRAGAAGHAARRSRTRSWSSKMKPRCAARCGVSSRRSATRCWSPTSAAAALPMLKGR